MAHLPLNQSSVMNREGGKDINVAKHPMTDKKGKVESRKRGEPTANLPATITNGSKHPVPASAVIIGAHRAGGGDDRVGMVRVPARNRQTPRAKFTLWFVVDKGVPPASNPHGSNCTVDPSKAVAKHDAVGTKLQVNEAGGG